MSNSIAPSYVTNPQINLNSIKTAQEQSLTDISNLQNLELDLFDKLTIGVANQTITPEQKTAYTQKISDLSAMRNNLYQNLNIDYNFYQADVQIANDTLKDQVYAIDVLEDALNEAKRRLALIEEERDNKRRLVEISTYYSQKYDDHGSIMRTVIYICVPIIIITILRNRQIISTNVFTLLFVIFLLIGGIILIGHVLDSRFRDNMYYDEYAFKAPTADELKNQPKLATPDKKDPWKSECGNQCLSDEINSMVNSLDIQGLAATGGYAPGSPGTPGTPGGAGIVYSRGNVGSTTGTGPFSDGGTAAGGRPGGASNDPADIHLNDFIKCENPDSWTPLHFYPQVCNNEQVGQYLPCQRPTFMHRMYTLNQDPKTISPACKAFNDKYGTNWLPPLCPGARVP